MSRNVATLVLCLLLTVSVKSQDRLWFDGINIDAGLSQSTVLCMLQDAQGFIWVGTQYGLNRFDGYQFEAYKNENNNDKSLSSNYIISLFEDSSGTLWVGTNNGLNAFDPSTNTFKRYLHNQSDPNSISNNVIADITEDQLGYIWVATAGGGLNRFDPSRQSFSSIALKSQNPLFITHVLIDEMGLLWVTTGKARLRPTNELGQIYQVNPKSLTTSQVIPTDKDGVIEMQSVTSIYQDDKNNIWFGIFDNGLIKKSANSQSFTHITNNQIIKNDSITAITQDKFGRIWFASQYKGIYQYDEKSQKMINYDSKSPEISNLNDDDVISFLVDSTGVFWLGTWTEGIKKLDFDSFQFQKYLQLANENNSAHQDVMDINQDSQGNIWIATWENGLLKFDLNTGNTSRPEVLSLDKVGLVRHVFIDKQDKIWLGTNDKGLIYFDPKNNLVKSYQHDPQNSTSISNNKIITITDDAIGNLWIATRGGGLNYFDRAEEKFSHYFHEDGKLTTINDNRVSALFMSDDDKLWVGTNAGLDIFDTQTQKVISHYQDTKTRGALLGNNINTIYKDHKENMWIGTEKGLSMVQFPQNNSYKKLSFIWDIGLSKSQLGSVGDILEDNNGNLWISSFKFITRYNPTTQAFKNYGIASGVLVGGYYIGSSYEDKNGTMFFGGLNGLTVFTADTKQKKTIPPKVVLTRLLLFNQVVYVKNDVNSILKTSINKTKELDFNYKQNVFSIEFSALHYSSSKDNQYAYKLDGFDEDWVATDSNNRRATYTNLDAGVYQFLIKASNNEGIWSKAIHKLNIRVHAAPWKTNLAYLIYFLVITSIIGGFIWLRLKQVQAIKLRNEQLSLTSKLFENTSECVWLLDNDLNFLTVNKGFCRVTGFSEEDTIGHKMSMAPVHGQDKKFVDVIFNTVRNGGRWDGEMWAKRKNGEVYPIEIVIDIIELNSKQFDQTKNQFVGVFSDITQRKKDEEELRNMAYYDKLTQLPNRRYFHQLVHNATLELCKNNEVLIFYLDLDDFKNINDSLGHSYGDQLLLIIADRLKKYSDNSFTIARMGGDEFALMVPKAHIQSPFIEQANQIGATILSIIRKQVKIKKHILHVSASIGISVFPHDGKNYEQLLRSADTAMYEAKAQGKNNFTLYSAQMNKAARKRLMLEDELNKAIKSHEIVPYYQPKVSLKTGEIYGLEILARWHHTKYGWMPPAEFIPIAEESRVINRISDQLLTHACQFLLPIIEEGKFKGRLSFNLSMTQFLQGDIVARIDTILKTCNFPSNYLEIEITESMVMKNINQAIDKMNQFKQREITIAIDDFGTGYSSLSHLKKFPINTLKIDISFIKDLLKSNEDRNIVVSIIQLAHNLGLEVVAEGGETIEQVNVLKDLGCEYLQGYYYSQALSGDDFFKLLMANKNIFEA